MTTVKQSTLFFFIAALYHQTTDQLLSSDCKNSQLILISDIQPTLVSIQPKDKH